MNHTDNPQPVTITRWALEVIQTEALASKDGLETGGILLGRDDEDGGMVVLIAGTPGPNAVRLPDRFLRDRQHAQALADQAWKSHGAQWIGEWHTHLNGQPVPSDIDLASYSRHLSDPELHFTRVASLIVATTDRHGPVLVPWVVTAHRADAVPLHVIDSEGQS
jgi:integrative and conjugative element protein (TIGR02256 family)